MPTYRKTRSRKRKRSSKAASKAGNLVKFRKTGRGRIRKATPARRASLRPPAKKARVTRKTPARVKSLPKDARPSVGKPKSIAALEIYKPPANELQVVREYRPKPTAKQLATKRIAKVKQTYAKAKDKAKAIRKGIDQTSAFLGKVAEKLEPIVDSMAMSNPELPGLGMAAGAVTAAAETHKLIEKTTRDFDRHVEDAFGYKTNEGKLRKVMGYGGAPTVPEITMSEHMDVLPAPTIHVEEID